MVQIDVHLMQVLFAPFCFTVRSEHCPFAYSVTLLLQWLFGFIEKIVSALKEQLKLVK